MNWRYYVHQSRRWLALAVLPAILIGALTYLYEKHLPKTYEATATLYVSRAENPAAGATGSDVVNSEALIPTYIDMLTSYAIYPAVERMMDRTYPGYHLGTVIASQPPSGGQLINVSILDSDQRRAVAATNALVTAFINRVQGIEETRYTADSRALSAEIRQARQNIAQVTRQISAYHGSQAGLAGLQAALSAYESTLGSLTTARVQFNAARDAQQNSVSVYAPATFAVGVGPQSKQTALMAMVLALLVLAGAVYLYDYLDDSPKTPEEISELAGAQVLGAVEEYDSRAGRMAGTRSPIAEVCRMVRTNIQFATVDAPPRTLLVTSASPEEGKTTVSSNLARVFAEGGRRVLLVDADLRRPSLHQTFNMPRRQEGLTTLLVNEHLNGNSVHYLEEWNFSLVTAGPTPPNPADLLSSQRMRSVIEHFSQEEDIVMIDSPPVLAVADSAILATLVDGVILVVDPSKTKRRDLRRTREAIETVGGRIVGVVINRLNPRRGMYYYYYSGDEYAYREDKPAAHAVAE